MAESTMQESSTTTARQEKRDDAGKGSFMPEYSSDLKVFVINDGGYTWWWIDTSFEAAKAQHIELNYTDAGVPLEESNITDCGIMPANKPLTIDGSTHSAELWVQLEGAGLLGSDV